MKGTVLSDRYELLEKIGEGGMALVYKARCQILDRIVAVKILKDEFSNDNSFVDKFKTEALSVARISHPNIVNVYDVGQENDIYYIVMEYVEGQTLEKIIQEKAPLDVENAIDITIMICDALNHAHNKGIIHRDIKPHNILFTNEGMIKVADFGIARAISNATITFGGNIVGSVHYISPEQAKGEPINATTDIYSLGCVLYEILTGKVPFNAESPITVALKHIHDEPVSPRTLNENIPLPLEGIINKAMEKLPVNRFQSAEEMRNALLNFHNSNFSNYNKNNKTLIMPAKELERNGFDMRKKRKIRPTGIALIVIAILGLLLGSFSILAGNLFPQEVVVPDIEGKDIKEARDELNNLGLKLEIIDEQFHEELEPDTIISQNPLKGQTVKQGREVRVILSKGPELINVPNVVGIELADARIALRNEGLILGTPVQEIFDDRYEQGVVISQSPSSGAQVQKGETVNLIISKGTTPNRSSVPNLVGIKVSEARQKLQEANLTLGEIQRQESNEYFADYIISQDTASGVLVEEESRINIVVSTGPGPSAQTKVIEFTLPQDQDYYKVVIRVRDVQGQREVYNQVHNAGDPVYVGVSYFGSGTAEVLLNNRQFKTYSL